MLSLLLYSFIIYKSPHVMNNCEKLLGLRSYMTQNPQQHDNFTSPPLNPFILLYDFPITQSYKML